MLLSLPNRIVSTYRVEVSGWDDSQTFFVEKSELEWSDDTGKHITLTRTLRPGSMVFVRLLQPTGSEPSHPVAYRTEYITATPEGRNEFRLTQARPGSEKT